MKPNILSLLLVICVVCISCEIETETDYQFKATVLEKGMDCGDTYLILLTNLTGDSAIINATYYADNLSQDLKISGLEIFLNCRNLKNDELSACTTFGISYPHVFVIDSKKVE